MKNKKTISNLLYSINEGEYKQAKSYINKIIEEKLEERIKKYFKPQK